MPEWPEMEHYRRLLTETVAGQVITAVEINREKSINVPSAEFGRRVVGRRVTAVDRRAKMLLFRLDGGDTLLLHLMLGGAICYGTDADKPDRTVQVDLSFGQSHLYFIGLRLGYLHLYRLEELTERLEDLGPEPFAPDLDATVLADRLRPYRRTLKVLLTDQSVIAAIGNCYSDEICFAAGLHPGRKPAELSDADINRLYHAMTSVLREALARGGYMEIPFRPGDGQTGGSIPYLRVYDRADEPCIRCGTTIIQLALSGKKTFCCPNCQR